MVYRNDNLKDKELNNSNTTPTYPFSVDVPSFPERKYLAGVYRFARISYISLFIAMIFCLLTIVYAFLQDINPRFIKWNPFENRYQYIRFNYESKPATSQQNINYEEYLNQYFVTTYIKKKFSISPLSVNNFNNWCNCADKTPSQMGIFNLAQECYLCFYSSSSVYKSFTDNLQPAYETMYRNNITRTVDIINITTERAFTNTPQTSMLDYFFKKSYKTIIENSYKVNFVVSEYENGSLKSRDVLIGYITIGGYKLTPEKRFVTDESYMFNPNYDLILKEYTEE